MKHAAFVLAGLASLLSEQSLEWEYPPARALSPVQSRHFGPRRDRNKYTPHQGERECARRIRQMAAKQLTGAGINEPARDGRSVIQPVST